MPFEILKGLKKFRRFFLLLKYRVNDIEKENKIIKNIANEVVLKNIL